MLALCATGMAAAAGADTGTRVGGRSAPATLQGRDLQALRDAACAPYGVAAEAVESVRRWTYDGAFMPTIEAVVRCAPHTTVNALPAYYNAECRRVDGRGSGWQCHGWEAIAVRTALGDVTIEPGPYSHELATRTVRAALASSLFREAVHAALPSGCRLASNWSAQGEEVAELSCASGHRFLFSFWCPQSDCPRLLTVTSLDH